MEYLRRAAAPVRAVATAARRPETYGGHLREVSSTLITAGMWPTGLRDSGRVAFAEPDRPTRIETPVLLLHGFGANKSNWLLVRHRLEQAGFARVDALNYRALTADICELADRVGERVHQLREHYGTDRVHIVGHSLGGVVARYAVQVNRLEGVGACVTVAAPHGGLRLAQYGSAFARYSPIAAGLQLRPGSSVMRTLRTSAYRSDTSWVAYYSNLDLIVPARRAMIREPELGATNILIKDHGHVSIMLSRRLSSSIVEQLQAASRASVGSAL